MSATFFTYPVTEDWDDPRLRQYFDYWHAGVSGRGPPPRSYFDPIDVKNLLGYFNVARVRRDDDRMRFQFTLWGTKITTLFGGEFTGKHVDEIMMPTEKGTVQDAFEFVAREQMPHYWRVAVPRPNRDFSFYSRLALPYLSEDTQEVSHIIALIIPDTDSNGQDT